MEKRVEKIVALRKRINEILDGLYERNKPLLNLVILSLYFNDIDWLAKEDKPKKKYPIKEIMHQLECSKRTAYDYSNSLDALDMCNKLSYEIDRWARAEQIKLLMAKRKKQ